MANKIGPSFVSCRRRTADLWPDIIDADQDSDCKNAGWSPMGGRRGSRWEFSPGPARTCPPVRAPRTANNSRRWLQ
jgi:hypothetical protein